uniref:Uncharacterized protein n=1 Tax=Anguilla anguilla TaxID=7936 RepID=A0A0E9R0A4_ANGAN
MAYCTVAYIKYFVGISLNESLRCCK